MDFSTSRTFNGGTGTASLIIGGGVTNTASVTTTLAGNGILTNLIGCSDATQFTNIFSVASNASWTLLDNSSSIPITTSVQLDMLGGTFTFGGPGSAPVLTSTIQNGNGNNFRLGNTVGVPATFNMVNGTLYLPNARLNTGLGANCIAQLNQTGGTLSLGLMQSSDSSANALTMMNLTGGTFTVTNAGTFFLASRGTGIVTVASSSIVNCGTLDMSRNAAGNTSGSQGTVNLNAGGTINCSRVGCATSASQSGPPTAGPVPTATFNFNGGTLMANASSATFFQGNASGPAIPITSIVKSGGAIIDTSSNAISILEPLQHDATLGATQDGGLLKRGAGTLTLAAVSTYTGNTTVSNGTLVVNGTLGVTAVTVATNATLSGTGSMGSNVTVNVGGTVAPGTAGTLGILTVVSNVTLLGTASMDINATTLTNDVLKAGSITYGGALTVTNVAGTLAAGSFKLFTAPTITGTFAATNLPVLPAGLGWVTTNLANGIVSIVQTVNTAPTNITTVVSGNTLTLSWPADHTGWRLQVQTNSLGNGLNPATNAWFTVSGSASVNSVNATLDSANGTVFYRMVYP
ncbi:MAG: autotransporter-associated beta strand repeat-containing protein [Verrucomicrobia bacterium]|nr:autotransporter-associated beta strand repeat-containing protein [Verrucomicrobiota bacterium]